MTSYYITTAIDYPNGKPHLGHAYEKILADVIARWHAFKGEDVFFLTGTDENSQKIVEGAIKEGITTEEYLERNVLVFKKLCEDLDIKYSKFIRTTQPTHQKISQTIFEKVLANDDIYKGHYEGLYCVECEKFYTEKDLEDGKCPTHKVELRRVKEESYFFKLSNYQARLIKHIKDNPGFILPLHKRSEILNRLSEPLQDLSISRHGTQWGIPVPTDETHVLYVWFDALINYISGVEYPSKTFERYWPCNVHIIGKDITWFHTVIWPIMLIAAGIELPLCVYSHGFITLKGEKLSKSRGNIVDPIVLASTFTSDAVRYYVMREIPTGQDGEFSEDALIERVNADIADGLGNLVNRVMVMLDKYTGGKIPECGDLTAVDKKITTGISRVLMDADLAMHAYEVHRALEIIWVFVHELNKYVNTTEPWKITDTKRRDTVLYVLVEALRNIACLTQSFIPRTAAKIAHLLSQPLTNAHTVTFLSDTSGQIKKAEIVFAKLLPHVEDPFGKLDLRVGKIETVEDHPNAEKLYVLRVHLGPEHRTIVAGIKEFIDREDLVGKHVIIVSNLKPAKLRGVESQGMLLAAELGDQLTVLQAPHSHSGDQVIIEGIHPGSSQITYDEFSKIKLTVAHKNAIYEGKVLHTEHGPIIADIGDGAHIR